MSWRLANGTAQDFLFAVGVLDPSHDWEFEIDHQTQKRGSPKGVSAAPWRLYHAGLFCSIMQLDLVVLQHVA